MNDLYSFLAAAKQEVDAKLNIHVTQAALIPQRLDKAVRWSLFPGGKRFRPALLIASGRMFGAADKALLHTAAAVEMIHAYSLVHDDLPAMDDDDLRRGRETCHRKFDEATAILTGDILQTLAFKAIATDENLTEAIKIKLLTDLAKASAEMVEGQQLDLEAEGKQIAPEDLEQIHRKKTGALISFSARAGAVIADASGQDVEAANKFGASLGLLFQITDDLLDVTETSAGLGKKAGKDGRVKKATYASLYGIEKAQAMARQIHADAIRALGAIDADSSLLHRLADHVLARRF